MLYVLSRRLRRLCSTIRWFVWRRRPHPRVIIRRLGRLNSVGRLRKKLDLSDQNDQGPRAFRLATFNAALFSLASAVPTAERSVVLVQEEGDSVKIPKGILKQSPLHPLADTNTNTNTDTNVSESDHECKLVKPRPKVSINLPENEISLAHDRRVAAVGDSLESSFRFNNTTTLSAMRSPICFPTWWSGPTLCGSRTIYDVLKEVDADILSLQDVKADEADDMKPLSELASALGMSYVFAESWAPEFGNAVLSRWPIKKWSAERICDDRDFRCSSVFRKCPILLIYNILVLSLFSNK